ncbi:uncharacterized protein [Anas acuta]|uniref:uncharacterized protein isoform X4 n=1 Tax=Anas acuta TaxID=28680 RepID=UPI0035C9107A
MGIEHASKGRVAEQGAPGLNNACGTTYAFCRTRANQPAATRNSRGLKMAPAFWDRQRVSCCLWSRAPWPDASCSDASHPELAVQTEPLHPDITSLVCYGTYSISPTLSRPQAYQGLKGNPPLQGGEVVSLWKHCICASA